MELSLDSTSKIIATSLPRLKYSQTAKSLIGILDSIPRDFCLTTVLQQTTSELDRSLHFISTVLRDERLVTSRIASGPNVEKVHFAFGLGNACGAERNVRMQGGRSDVKSQVPFFTEDSCTNGGCKITGGNGGVQPPLQHREQHWAICAGQNGNVWSPRQPVHACRRQVSHQWGMNWGRLAWAHTLFF